MFEVVSLNARTGQKVSTQRGSFLPLPFLFSRTRITIANGFGQTIASKNFTGYHIADGWKEPNHLMWGDYFVLSISGNACRKREISTKIVKTRIIMALFVREALYLNYVP